METSQRQHQEQIQDLHQIQVQVNAVDKKLDQVLAHLMGNELDKETGGMIKQVKSQEKRIFSLERLRDKLIWFTIGVSFFAGYGVWDLINKINK